MAPRESLVFPSDVVYGQRWTEDGLEYRLVKLNREAYEKYRKFCLTKPNMKLTEAEWRGIVGLRMSPGWIHFLLWPKEPNILCFRRPVANSTAPPHGVS